MKESGISVVLDAGKGAIRKTSAGKGAASSTGDGKYRGSKQTERRVEAELKGKKQDEAWQKEKKEREEGFERQRLNHEEMMKRSGHQDASAWHMVNFPKYHGREDDEEVDNIVETRFETTENWGGPLLPLPPHPATNVETASLDAERISTPASEEDEEEEEEEEKKKKEEKKSKGRPSKKSSKKPSYMNLLEAMKVLARKLEKEKKKNKALKKEKTPESDTILNRRSSESESSTIKDYSEGEVENLLASPLSKFVARPKTETPMDAE